MIRPQDKAKQIEKEIALLQLEVMMRQKYAVLEKAVMALQEVITDELKAKLRKNSP